MEARTTREESVMQAIGLMGMVMEPLTLLMERLDHYLVVKYHTEESEEIRLHRLC